MSEPRLKPLFCALADSYEWETMIVLAAESLLSEQQCGSHVISFQTEIGFSEVLPYMVMLPGSVSSFTDGAIKTRGDQLLLLWSVACPVSVSGEERQ